VECSNCGYDLHREPPRRPDLQPGNSPAAAVSNPGGLMIRAVLVTFFCCLPTGVVAIVYAARVQSCNGRGDLEGAHRAAVVARRWIVTSVLLGLASLLLSMLSAVIQSAAGSL